MNKLEKIKEEHPRVNIGTITKTYAGIVDMRQRDKEVTITKVAKVVKLPRTNVQTAMQWLLEYQYIEKVGQGKSIPFFIVTDNDGEPDFLYGREKIDKVITSNLDWFRVWFGQEIYNQLKQLREDKFSKFLIEQNKLVKSQWQRGNGLKELCHVELASKAVRYDLAS